MNKFFQIQNIYKKGNRVVISKYIFIVISKFCITFRMAATLWLVVITSTYKFLIRY